MEIPCPNTKTKKWNDLVEGFGGGEEGRGKAYLAYMREGTGRVPSIEKGLTHIMGDSAEALDDTSMGSGWIYDEGRDVFDWSKKQKEMRTKLRAAKKAGVKDSELVKEFPTQKDAEKYYMIGTEQADRIQALREAMFHIDDEGNLVDKPTTAPETSVKIGDKYYRALDKSIMERNVRESYAKERDASLQTVTKESPVAKSSSELPEGTWGSKEEALANGAKHPIFDNVVGSKTEGRWIDVGAFDKIFGNQRGSVELPSYEDLRDAIDQVKGLMSSATQAKVSLPEFVNSLSQLSGDDKQKIIQFGQNLEKHQKTLRTLMKEQVKKDSAEPDRVAVQATEGMKGELQSDSQVVRNYVQWMKENHRIVDPYVSGSKELPIAQEPLFDPIRPEVKIKSRVPAKLRSLFRLGEVRDISKPKGWKPSDIFHMAFPDGKGPVMDMIEAYEALGKNVPRIRQYWGDVLKGVESGRELITKNLIPIVAKYQKEFDAVGRLNSRIGDLKRNIEGTNSKTSIKIWKRGIDLLNQELKVQLEKLGPFKQEYLAKSLELAQQNDSIMAVMHASGQVPEGMNVSPKALELSARFRQYLDEYIKPRMEKVGLATKGGDTYIPHIWRQLLNGDSDWSKDTKSRIPSSMDFMHQLPDGVIPIPDLHGILDTYIPLVERKLALQPFITKWSNFANGREFPRLQSYMKEWINRNIYPERPTEMIVKMAQDIANGAVNFEYARQLGGSLSTMRKHFEKGIQSVATAGFKDSARAMVLGSKIPVQTALRTLGIEGEANELKVLNVYYSTKDLVQQLDGDPLMYELGRTGNQYIKKILSAPISLAEGVDNGITILASLLTGADKGMEFEKVHRGIWESVLLNNYRGGPDQPLWQKGFGFRVGAMFQSTRWKNMEWKVQVANRWLRGENDVFGRGYGSRLGRQILIAGSLALAAKQAGQTVWKDFVEIPGFNEDKAGPTISPVVNLLYQTGSHGVVEGVEKFYGPGTWGMVSKVHKINRSHYPTAMYSSALTDLLGIKRDTYEPGEITKEKRKHVRRKVKHVGY